MTSRIRAVFFDLYDTLIGFDPPRELIQRRALESFGLDVTLEGVDAGYALADAHMAEQTARAPLSALSAADQDAFFARYEQLVLHGAGHQVELETAAAVWRAVRKQEYGFALYDDVAVALDGLRSDGYTVGVITNMSRPGEQVARDMGFERHVDFTISSLDIGASKPDPRMFAAAISRAGTTAARSVHVGDQVGTDVEGARAAGVNPVLIDRHSARSDFQDCPRIAGLDELPAVLAAMNGL